MKDYAVDAFQAKVQGLADYCFPASDPEVQETNRLRLKMRIVLSSNMFIDVFYSASKKRIDFALIKVGNRVFGIDNLSGWHRHPFGEVEQHEAMKDPTLEEIFSEIKSVTTEQGFV
jgi:hypothetical protein